MLKDIEWPKGRRFKSNTLWEPVGFFSDCLCHSQRFDLMLGFFSSSAINVLAYGFAAFISRGGHMRMVINDILSVEDKDAISAGSNDKIGIPAFDLSDLGALKETLGERGQHFFDCLAWMIREKRIELKIVAPLNDFGIAHNKCGLFEDGINKVAFEGSCNFSRTALLENNESLSVFCSWDGETECYRIEDVENDFENTFSGDDRNVHYIDPDKIKKTILRTSTDKKIEKLLEEEQQIIKNEINKETSLSVREALNRAKEQVEKELAKIRFTAVEPSETKLAIPHFPYPSGPREYQKQAFENWKNNKQKGLFAMATGTGKTLTALNCLLEVYKKCNYYKAIILAPTLTLVEQWEDECLKFGFDNVIKISSKHKWNNEIDNLLLREKVSNQSNLSFVIICTYQSYSKRKVFEVLNRLSPRTMFVADECHNMGSPEMLKLLPLVKQSRRIGLSATPERQFDEAINKIIKAFFDASEGYTYEYSMEEAIENGVLCKYYYYPHAVSLTNKEMEEYVRLTKKIVKYYNFNSGKFKDDPILTALLLARKRIIHKAANKLEVFRTIIEEWYRHKGNLNYTLVYVPEGNEVGDYTDTEVFDQETGDEDVVAQSIIDTYTTVVKEVEKQITVRKFTSNSSNRDEMLVQFAKGEISVLTSMKCLDEGVDVPRAELAIFCASTGNPRQFIQRRGRILRKHPDKEYATIHDLVVIPAINDDECFEMERRLLRSELDRVRNFALLSLNSADTFRELLNIMNYYNLNLYDNA